MTRRKKRFLYCLSALIVLGILFAQGGLTLACGNMIGAWLAVKYSMRLTADLLSFTEKNDLDNGKANCVGYAVLCSRICNYAFQVNGMGIERSLWWATCRSMASIYAACFRLLPLSDGRIL